MLLRCPSCGAEAIPLSARRKLHPLRNLQCPVCQDYLKLKWGRLLFLGYLTVMALLAVCEFSNVIPRFHKLPSGVVVTCVFFFISSFYAFARRLPLEPRPLFRGPRALASR